MTPHYNYLLQRARIDLSTIKTALDIGCGAGEFANDFAEKGVAVTAIDIKSPAHLHPSVRFTQAEFEAYEPGTSFDLVHARNVLPFMKDKPEQVRRMLAMGTYVFFTFFGPHDPWHHLTISKDEILTALAGAEILYISEEEFIGRTMTGEMKPWHIFTVIAKSR